MFVEIKNCVLSELINEYSKKKSLKNGVIPFLFDKILNVLLISLGYFLLLFVINSLFRIKIVRSFLVITVCTMEIIIICKTKFSNFDEELKNIPFIKKKTALYYANLTMYAIKNFISNIYFVLPFLIAYGIFRNATFDYYFNCTISMILLPISTVIISLILPNIKNSNSVLLNKFFNLLNALLSLITYTLIFVLLRNYFNLFYQMLNNETIYNVTNNLLSLPTNLSEMLKIDLLSLLLGFSGGNTTNVFFTFSFILIILSFSIYFLKLNFLYKKLKLSNKKTNNFNLQKNNVSVFRINKILKSCLPRSPTL